MTRTVLCVEDNYHNRRLVAKALVSQGYRVLLAEDDEMGWRLALAERPRLLLLDIALPGALDGLALAGRIKAEPTLSEVRIVALTASVMPSDRERCLRAGCDDYLAKPIRVGELIDTVKRCLAQTEESGR